MSQVFLTTIRKANESRMVESIGLVLGGSGSTALILASCATMFMALWINSLTGIAITKCSKNYHHLHSENEIPSEATHNHATPMTPAINP